MTNLKNVRTHLAIMYQARRSARRIALLDNRTSLPAGADAMRNTMMLVNR